MDAYALRSHQRSGPRAQEEGHFAEIEVDLRRQRRATTTHDDGVRADSSMETLAGLKPVFDKPFGKVTAGNSAQVTDGAAWLILAIGGRRVDATDCRCWGGSSTANGPAWIPRRWASARCTPWRRCCSATVCDSDDIDYWEINEAFAAQVLACLAAWQDAGFCREELGLRARRSTPLTKHG